MYVLRIWELSKAKLYDNPNVQQSPFNCISLSSSAQCSGCVVNGLGAMAAV